MAFDLKFYQDKLAKLQQKNQRVLQQYINDGITFGQEVAEINQDIKDVERLIAENTPKPQPKEEIVPIPKDKKR